MSTADSDTVKQAKMNGKAEETKNNRAWSEKRQTEYVLIELSIVWSYP
jgi:hypothetical protein